MTRSNPLFTALLFIPMLLPVVSACSLGHSKAAPAALTAAAFEAVKPVAEVNGTRISRAELDRAKKVVLANKPGLKVPPLLQKEFELQTLNQLISSELLFQAGRKLEAMMKDCAAQMRFEQAHAFKKQLEYLAGLAKPDFQFVSELSGMSLLHVDIGPKAKQAGKKTKDQFYMPFIVRGGLIYKLPDFVAGADLNIFEVPGDLAPYAPDADKTSQMSLAAYSLFRQSRSGLWLNLSRLTHAEAAEQLTAYLNAEK